MNLIIIIKKLFSSENENNGKKFYNEKILIKICVIRQKFIFSLAKFRENRY